MCTWERPPAEDRIAFSEATYGLLGPCNVAIIVQTSSVQKRTPDVGREDLNVISNSLAETQRLGTVLGQLLDGREVICLQGELGTGKTSLVQAIARAQEVREPITSPTFTLVNEYHGRAGKIYHVDLYRLTGTEEIAQAGIDAYFHADGICLIEWAEKAEGLLPLDRMLILLEHGGQDRRIIHIEARGESSSLLLHRLKLALETER
jgi:tRNA threonylcarbamoyladenosine biosynthesis protein TsaE